MLRATNAAGIYNIGEVRIRELVHTLYMNIYKYFCSNHQLGIRRFCHWCILSFSWNEFFFCESIFLDYQKFTFGSRKSEFFSRNSVKSNHYYIAMGSIYIKFAQFQRTLLSPEDVPIEMYIKKRKFFSYQFILVRKREVPPINNSEKHRVVLCQGIMFFVYKQSVRTTANFS